MATTPETNAAPTAIQERDPFEFTPEEAWADFADKTREALGIEPDEFLRRLDAGEYNDILDDPEHGILYLMLLGRGLRSL